MTLDHLYSSWICLAITVQLKAVGVKLNKRALATGQVETVPWQV